MGKSSSRGRSRPRRLAGLRLPKLAIDPVVLRRLLIVAGATVLFGIVVTGGAWVRACANEKCPSIAGLNSYDPNEASKVFAADGRLITDFYRERRTVVTLDSMSTALPAAFLAVEDHRFYKHGGVDWVGVLAAVKDRLIGRGGRGASTITMQLAGNLWPADIDRSKRSGLAGIARKVREARVAQQIEERYSKDKILELYLNYISLGNGAYGVEAASQRYFGKHASEINPAEAAMLAGLPQAPSRYNPRRNPEAAVKRRNLVLDLMRQDGALTAEEAETWKAYPLALSSRSDFAGVGEYFVEYVRQILEARFGSALYTDGYRIFTTLDLDAQGAVERAMAAQLERIESDPRYRHETYREYLEGKGDGTDEHSTTPYLQGAALVMEARTGNILAMVGGRDFDDSKFNRVVQAERQPGSTFKPIVYTAAVEHGIPLDQVQVDEPISIPIPDQPNWEPQNYNGKFTNQPMTLREGLWGSVNTIAIKTALETGLPEVVDEARKFGLTTRIPVVPSLALGSLGVHPIEMISAYSTFANLGVRAEPNAILRVEDNKGRIVYEAKPVRRRVLDEPTAYTMTDALVGVVQHGTGRPEVWNKGFQVPSGGKTGTTNDYYDVWYIGFTNDLVAGVWMGFDQNTKIMSNAQGGLLAAPAYTQFMREIYQRRPTPGGWQQPADMLRPVEIDRTTGFRATPFCPRDAVEIRYFAPGQEPREYCPIHSPYRPGDTE